MPEQTITSYGSELHYGNDILANTPTYTEIDQVASVTPPGVTVGVTETKWLKKADRTVGKKPAWTTPGDVSATLYYDKARMGDLYPLVGIERAFKVVLADNSTIEFDGIINSFGQPELNGDDETMIEMSIAVSGKPAFTEAVAV